MISFCEETNIFYLQTDHTSYIMRILENGTFSHSYYGKRIPQDDLRYYNLFRPVGFSPLFQAEGAKVSLDVLPQECPTSGRGDFRAPALVLENELGQRVNELTYKSHRIYGGKPSFPEMPQLDGGIEDCETLEITLEDKVGRFEAVLYYSVFEKEDVIGRRVRVKNLSNENLMIRQAASLCLDMESKELDMVTLEGAWARERHIERYPLHHGTTSVESRRGASSHQLNPFAALVGKNTDEDQGEVIAVSLIYSGDFKIQAEKNHYGGIRLLAGLHEETFSWELTEGDSFVTPEALLVYSDRGFGGMSKAFHRVCRNYLGKSKDKKTEHPIVVNNGEAMYFNLTEEKLIRFIRDCRGLGIDTMVLDDGWFGHRTNSSSSLGDWFVDPKRFPEGLHHILKCCKDNGLKFGIWFEPEMISRDSELYRAHPDWCIHAERYEPVESRHQLVLDMSRKEICDAVFEQMAAIFREYDISYVKWDMNRHITDNGAAWLPAHRQKEHGHRYILGVYDLMDRLTKAFPEIFFEGCSGGGGRFDFGILYYMTQIWTSDDSDAVERLKIQYGTSLVYPVSSMAAHVSACPNHQTGRVTSFQTRGDVAQVCNFGYELDIGELSQEEKEMIREQTAKHRELKKLIAEGDFYRLKSPFEGNTCAWQLVSKDRKKSYVVYVRMSAKPNYSPEYLRVKGLIEQRTYLVKQLNIKVSGSTLMNAGIPIKLDLGDYRSLTFDVEALED